MISHCEYYKTWELAVTWLVQAYEMQPFVD